MYINRLFRHGVFMSWSSTEGWNSKVHIKYVNFSFLENFTLKLFHLYYQAFLISFSWNRNLLQETHGTTIFGISFLRIKKIFFVVFIKRINMKRISSKLFSFNFTVKQWANRICWNFSSDHWNRRTIQKTMAKLFLNCPRIFKLNSK